MIQALLLRDESSPREERVARTLSFFGIRGDHVTITELLERIGTSKGKSVLISQPGVFTRLLSHLEREGNDRSWTNQVAAAFVYAGNDSNGLQILARNLTSSTASLQAIGDATEWVISGDHQDFCGALSGLRVIATTKIPGLVFDSTPTGTEGLIRTSNDSVVLLKTKFEGVPIFLCGTTEIIDLDAILDGRNFDLRRHFLTSAPIVLFIKWAFSDTSWKSNETGACLVIDDPLLKPRYGFLHYESFLQAMTDHQFCANIAFIPWNWYRSTPKVARMFLSSQGRLSISIHGCDHTRSEFGSQHPGRIGWKTREASARMARHQALTGIQHDRIMVFPQGVFSGIAMKALKHNHFVAAVNTELQSEDPSAPPITIGEAWGTALTRYSGLPLFTRRYPSDGVENFAFDTLLGKPCLVVIHHQNCRGRYSELLTFIDRLNAVTPDLKWRSLEEVVLRSWRFRENDSGVTEVEMFGSKLLLHNSHTSSRRFHVMRTEPEPDMVAEIAVDGQPCEWKCSHDRISFSIEMQAGAHAAIRIAYAPLHNESFAGYHFPYKIKVMARRILSEFRDNYIVRKPFSA